MHNVPYETPIHALRFLLMVLLETLAINLKLRVWTHFVSEFLNLVLSPRIQGSETFYRLVSPLSRLG